MVDNICSRISFHEFNQRSKDAGFYAVGDSAWVGERDFFIRNEGPENAPSIPFSDAAVQRIMKQSREECEASERAIKKLVGSVWDRIDPACRRISVDDFNEMGRDDGVSVSVTDRWVDARDEFPIQGQHDGPDGVSFDHPEVQKVIHRYQTECEENEHLKREMAEAYGLKTGELNVRRPADEEGDIFAVFVGREPLFHISSRYFVDGDKGAMLGGRFFTRRQLAEQVAEKTGRPVPYEYRPVLRISGNAFMLMKRERIVIDFEDDKMLFRRDTSSPSGERREVSFAGSLEECGYNVAVEISVDKKNPNELVFEFTKEDGSIERARYDLHGRQLCGAFADAVLQSSLKNTQL